MVTLTKMLYLLSLLFTFLTINPLFSEKIEEENPTIKIFGDEDDDQDDDVNMPDDDENEE